MIKWSAFSIQCNWQAKMDFFLSPHPYPCVKLTIRCIFSKAQQELQAQPTASTYRMKTGGVKTACMLLLCAYHS